MTEYDYRKKFVSNALAYNGIRQGSIDHKQLIDIYNSQDKLPRGYKVKYTDNWCAAYVSAVSINCKMQEIIPTECSCIKMIEQFKSIGRWVENDAYIPSIGDILFYDWEDDGIKDNIGSPNHVGIVASISNDGMMTIIEGNKGDTHAVGLRYVFVNGKYIRGYAIPNFKSLVKECNDVYLPILSKGTKSGYVKTSQILLNKHLNYRLVVDGIFGSKTEAATKKFQNIKNIKIDGKIGQETWGKLLSFE